MIPSTPLLFALHGSEDYASRVANRLGLPLAALEERDFEDGEHKSRPLEPVLGRQVVVFHSLHGEVERSVNDKLCRLLSFAEHSGMPVPRACMWSRRTCATPARNAVPNTRTRSSAAMLRRCWKLPESRG